jgi:hypothetical protein
MADPTQFMLSHKRIVELIIKDAGLHEGHWMLAVNFGLGPGNFGPTEETMSPGAVLAITQIGIQRVPTAAPAALVVDAAEVNPRERARTPKGRSKS